MTQRQDDSNRGTVHWTPVPWGRYDSEPPTASHGSVEIDGVTFDLVERIDPAWHAEHWHPGAWIRDEARLVTYRGTVDPETLELDYLEIVYEGHAVPRGTGVRTTYPVERIASLIRASVLEQRRTPEDAILVFGVGDDLDPVRGDGSMRKPPPSSEIAALMRPVADGGKGLNRTELAAKYGRPVRTVDNWIARARSELPEEMPPRTRSGPGKKKTSDAKEATATNKEIRN